MMGGVFLRIDYCEFPDDVLYDIENNVWIKLEDKKHARIGITSVHAALAGKLKQVMFKPTNVFLQAGQAVATIESVRYFGAVRTPLTARLVEVNLRDSNRRILQVIVDPTCFNKDFRMLVGHCNSQTGKHDIRYINLPS